MNGERTGKAAEGERKRPLAARGRAAGRWRGAALVARVACLAGWLAAFGLPGTAQAETTDIVLVSNESTLSSDVIDDGITVTQRRRSAHSFRIQSTASDYVLSEVSLWFAAGASPVPVVTVHETQYNRPGALLYTLSNPSTVSLAFGELSENTFTAPGNAILAAGNTYWLQVRDSQGSFTIAGTASGTDTGESGWSIMDGNRRIKSGDGTWESTSGVQIMKFTGRVNDSVFARTVELTSMPSTGGYRTGEVIEATVTFSGAVDVTGTPTLALKVGANRREAAYVSGAGTSSLVFTYTVADDDNDNDGVTVGVAAFTLPAGASITKHDSEQNAALASHSTVAASTDHKVNAPPSIKTRGNGEGFFTFHSSPAAAPTVYGLGETILISPGFDQVVIVDTSGGTPTLELALAKDEQTDTRLLVYADYVEGSGTADPVFGYVVKSGDRVLDGIRLRANALRLNSGTIQGTGGVDAILDHNKVNANSAHAVNADLTPPAPFLDDLSLSHGTLSPAFAADRLAYAAAVGADVEVTTVTADAPEGVEVSILPSDADVNTSDHEVALAHGVNTITVTASRPTVTTVTDVVYQVTVNRASLGEGFVTAVEDTPYTFALENFSFVGSDAYDTLASIKVVTLPAAGGLTLAGAAVTADQVVAAADIGTLVFTPALNANGLNHASFTFRVIDDDSVENTSNFTMTVHVTPANDPPTGLPTISGQFERGRTLTAATDGIEDVEGLSGVVYAYQWIRVDADGTSNATVITDATADTYTLASADVGKKIKVKVDFTDDGATEQTLTSDAYPSNGTIAELTGGICGRTEQVITAILNKISRPDDLCADVTDARLAQITGMLDLAFKEISELAAGDFDGLSSLTGLKLSNNPLTALPAGLFDDLSSLEDLILQTTSISSLPAGLFDGLTSLKDLDLLHNRISTFPAGLFDNLRSLERLYLKDNGLSTFPEGIFANLSSLKYLFLWNQELDGQKTLSELPAGLFDGLSSLVDLHLASNDLTTLPAGIFDGLSSLDKLYLSGNEITMLPAGIFDELSSLTTRLELDGNELTTLPAGVFAGLTRLRSLHLNNNKLSTLPAGVFDDLSSLTFLDLKKNQLQSLPAGVFERLTKLVSGSLILKDNPGTPFAPTAVALPDDGTISNLGGTMRLDGSGSGGPWGKNVTYRWEVTDPPNGVTVTFDRNTKARPEVMIPALDAGTELTFTVTVNGRGATLPMGGEPGTDTATVTVIDALNDPTLSGLTVNAGTSALALAPVFAPNTLAYTTSVKNTVVEVTLTAALSNSGAKVSAVTLGGTAITDNNFSDGITVPSLVVGDNVIVVTVTAEDTTTTQDYTLTVTRSSNLVPTAADKVITIVEDMAHTFAEGEFNFSDGNATDTLANVTVVTLPTAGGLKLDGTAVTAGEVVPVDEIDTLVFTPVADANGTDYASFEFRVSDGEDDSDATYTMTVHVTPVNDEPTGLPTISGTAKVGQSLMAATTGIDDADGLDNVSYDYQWIRVDDDGTSNATDITDATANTYTLTSADTGKKIKVKVGFTDDGNTKETLTSDAYPSNATITESTSGICGRTEQVRTAILAAVSRTDCATVTDTHLAAITGSLTLFNVGLADLTAGDFAGLTGLVHLFMTDNPDLTELPAGLFDELSSLQTLTLNDNGLSSLQGNAFAELDSLTYLELEGNALTELPPGLFDGLTKLVRLRLDGNQLTTIPAGVDSLVSLQVLNLRDNKLTTLPAGAFDSLVLLQELHLDANELDQNPLPDDLFAPLTALTTLELQQSSNRGTFPPPFKPAAVALPDNGAVSSAGGTVTLDGSGSGGAWGTNVTYKWVLSKPTSGVTVTFDDDTRVTPQVMIPELAVGTELTFKLTVTGRGDRLGTTSDGIKNKSDNAKVTAAMGSDDATLSGLTVNDGTSDRALGPTFAPNTLAYTVSVKNPVQEVTLTATVNDAGAEVSRVTLGGNAIEDDDFTDGITVPSLSVGANEIVVTVTAENSITTEDYTVTVTVNTVPTASDKVITTLEDTAHTFAADEFNFSDGDTTDTLANVTVVTVPTAGELKLGGTAVTAGDVVPVDDIDTLVFRPASDANGMDYASFEFRVSDGKHDSDATYTMTVHVTAVNDTPTGQPTISGTPKVGQTLTAATADIADVDGPTNPTYSYQWIRVDDGTEAPITDATSATYLLAEADKDKTIKVQVGFTDGGGTAESVTSDEYPENGTISGADGICERTTAVQTAIIAAITGVSACANVTYSQLGNITSLSLDNVVASFKTGDFDGLKGLKTLYVINNELLTSLPAGVFDSLKVLESLFLNQNDLGELPPGIFDSLTALKTLHLANNDLASLPAGVFDSLKVLQYLHLTLNVLTTLPAGVFDSLGALERLDLNGNLLKPDTLPDRVFEGLTNIGHLDLSENKNRTFAPTAVARPDDGKVSSVGGTVELDGSESGGAWGTNVTYAWALTKPATAMVTFDDGTIAKPKVTIPALAVSTELTFTLTVSAPGAMGGIDAGTDTATVTVNTVPTASNSKIEIDENETYPFVTGDFNFADGDAGDVLASVAITSLPAAGKGTLKLDDTAISSGDLPQTVTADELNAKSLTYTPPADESGDDFATFTFRVNDGTDPSASTYTMTVDVDAVHQAATGQPEITGTVAVGETLTAGKGDIDDSDGLPATFPDDYTFQWVRVDSESTETIIAGATSSTYTLVAEDVGSTIKVRVSFTDGGNTGEGPLESDATAVVPVTVAIAANHDRIGAGIEDLVFTLTRHGPTADALEVAVDIVQAESWLNDSNLSHTVTFGADEDTALLEFTSYNVSLTPESAGNLTATVSGTGFAGGAKTVEMVSVAHPPITVSFDEDAYTFAEDADEEDVNIYVVATLDPAYPRVVPVIDIQVFLETDSDTARNPADFGRISADLYLDTADVESGTRQVARQLFAEGTRKFAIVNDDVYEGNEQLDVEVESSPFIRAGLVRYRNADGSLCEGTCKKTSRQVTITDEEDVPALSLAAVPESIPEADDDMTGNIDENESVLTVSITNDKTFAVDQVVTLAFAGDAPGSDYAVTPADADPNNTAGHQVTLPAGAASVTVTLTAQDNLARDDSRTVTVSGSLDDVAFGQATVTITDDDGDNVAPMASDGAVTAVEDTAYEFTAADFNFEDTDAGDVLRSVSITSLPAAATGTLKLDGTAISSGNLPQTVTAAELGANSLTYTPPAGESGRDFAKFTFRVSDGTDPSASTYTMTVHVRDKDAATGQPAITGTVAVGETLTAAKGDIADPNGLPATFPDDYTFQWVRVDSTSTETPIMGATSSTYVPVFADMGSTIKVRVSFTDGGANAEGPLESDATAVVPVPVTIAANQDRIGAGTEELVFTLTRPGSTANPLEVTVGIVQAESWLDNSDLSHTVTFGAGDDGTELRFSEDDFDDFLLTPATGGNLTATVSGTGIAGGEKTVEIVSLAYPPITMSFDQDAYTFAEDADEDDVNVYVVATLDPAYPRAPTRDFRFLLLTAMDTASLQDYGPFITGLGVSSTSYRRVGSSFVARTHFEGLTLRDDDVYEGSESFYLSIDRFGGGIPTGLVQFKYPDGSICVPLPGDERDCREESNQRYPVTITDEGDVPELSLAAVPVSISEADDDLTQDIDENVSKLTVSITNGKTFAVDRMVTLTFAGTAPGSDYEVAPADADPNTTAGHQVTLPAGHASVAVTLTAKDNTAVDGSRTVAVSGSLDDAAFGQATVTITDDEGENIAPRVTSITRQNPTTEATNANSLIWRVTFSEHVANVDAGDFTVSGTTATVTAVSQVTATTVYDVTVSGGDLASLNTTVTLSFASGQNITDRAGAALTDTAPTGTNAPTYDVDNTAPAVTITGVPATSTAAFTATFTFSEAVTGFVVGDVTVGNGEASAFMATSERVYTALITPAAAGNVTVNVAAAAAQDAAGNDSTAATQVTSSYTAAPRVTSIERQTPTTEATNADSLKWRVTFSEDVANVDGADFTVSGTTATVTAVSQVTATTVYDVTVSEGNLASLTATVTLGFASGQNITDTASNELTNTTPTGANEASYAVDNTVPSVDLAEVTDTELVVTFNDALAAANLSNDAFTVARTPTEGSAQTVTLSGTPVIAGRTVTLTLGAAVVYGDTVTLSYTKPSGGTDDTLKDLAGNEAASFSGQAVTNKTADAAAPRVTSIERQTPTTEATNADSLKWRVTFSEDVANVDGADFTVSGTTATVTAVSQVTATTVYDVTVSEGNLASLTATVTLGSRAGRTSRTRPATN